MKIIDKTQTNYKTHKFSFDKTNKNIKRCKKCNLKIHKIKELQGSVWTEDIQDAINDLMMITINDSLSALTGNKQNIDDHINIVDVSENCNDHVIKNIIE